MRLLLGLILCTGSDTSLLNDSSPVSRRLTADNILSGQLPFNHAVRGSKIAIEAMLIRKTTTIKARVATLLVIGAIVLGLKYSFVAENITVDSGYGFVIGETYSSVYQKASTLNNVKVSGNEKEIWIDYGGLWHINTVRLQFEDNELTKIEKRRALFELP